MVSQITRGIKIIVKAHYFGSQEQLGELVNCFDYEISIENHSNDVVQLLRRYWLIKDALNQDIVVEGEGVVGKQPVVYPQDIFKYVSGSFVKGHTGSMQGYFTFINKTTLQIFHVKIPLFNLSVPYIFN